MLNAAAGSNWENTHVEKGAPVMLDERSRNHWVNARVTVNQAPWNHLPRSRPICAIIQPTGSGGLA